MWLYLTHPEKILAASVSKLFMLTYFVDLLSLTSLIRKLNKLKH